MRTNNTNNTGLVSIDQLMETVACVAQLEEHVCIFDVVADLVLDDSSTVDQPSTGVSSSHE